MKIVVISDKKEEEKLRKEMRENGNICPIAGCYCMCTEFLMNTPAGQNCAFGLYKKVEE